VKKRQTKTDPSFGELLHIFEMQVREHQMERGEYKAAYRKDLEVTKLCLIEMYHRAKMDIAG
jgi:hypothetical protein